MPRSMLSLHRGIPIAHALDKKGNQVLTIHITDDEMDPDIEVDRIEELINHRDFVAVKKIMKLLEIESRMIQKAIHEDSESGTDSAKDKLSDRLKLALYSLKEMARMRLKKEISFEKSNEIDKLVPFIGADEVPFDRSIFLTGPSGSGKSFLATQIMKHDHKQRPIIIFSKIADDESLQDLKKLKLGKGLEKRLDLEKEDGKPRMIKIALNTDADLLNLPCNEELKNCVCLFDDIDAFPKDVSDFINFYRNSILECGRHHNITVLSTSHQLFNWAKTRVLLNESELVCLFPHSNKRSSMQFLKDRMGIHRDLAHRIVEESMDAGRSLICKLSCPNLIMHEKGVILL